MLGSIRTRFTSLLMRSRTRSAASSSYQGQNTTHSQEGSTNKGRYNNYINLSDGAMDKAVLTGVATGRSDAVRVENFPLDSIHVQHSVDIV
jgi:hypothetical protein